MGQISGTWELLLRDYWRKSMIIGEKNTDLKRLTGQLTLRFLTEIGWFHWNQGKKVAHFAWFGEPWCSCKSMCTIWSRWPIRIIIFEMQWNLSKIHWTNFCVQNRQVVSLYRLNWQRIPTLRLYLKFGLFRILVYSGFDIDKFLCTCTCTQYHYWFYRYSVYSVHIDSP
jgi:hypothetical protein